MKVTIIKNDDQSTVITVDNSTATLKGNTCKFKFSNDVSAEEIIQTIQAANNEYRLTNGDSSSKIDFQLTKKMHQKIREGSYLQRVRYVQLVECVDAIWRQDQYRDAVNFYEFMQSLKSMGIVNYFDSEFKSKRIIAVHHQYVKRDEEIREGLKVMHHKHKEDYPVFVESEASLIYALNDCLPGSTLVVDGHWVHGKSVRHGVWDPSNAEELAEKIANLVNNMPGKISHINLLGCESGMINSSLEGVIVRKNLFFKYDHKPELKTRFMAEQRNRAIYVSTANESVFSPDSLAFKLIAKLADPSIAVTATPKLLYPWPPNSPRINIGSDSDNWKDEPQAWEPNTSPEETCALLGEIKSVTQINSTEIDTHSKRPWTYRMS